jgi:hypothetical protein
MNTKIYAVMKACGESVCLELFRRIDKAVNFAASHKEICEVVELNDNGNGVVGRRYFGEFYYESGDRLIGLTSAHTSHAACRAEMHSHPYPAWSRYTLSVFSCALED